MRQQRIYYRQVGVRGPGDNALRPVVVAQGLGVWRRWHTAQPRGLHFAVKRWGITGRVVVHSFFSLAKRPAANRSSSSGIAGRPTKRHYLTEVRSLSQTINHAGVAFTVGRLGR